MLKTTELLNSISKDLMHFVSKATSPLNALGGYRTARTIITLLQNLGPLSIIYSIGVLLLYVAQLFIAESYLHKLLHQHQNLSLSYRLFEAWVLIEGCFFTYCLYLKKAHMDVPRKDPPQLSKADRQKLFSNMYSSIGISNSCPRRFLRMWFKNISTYTVVKRGNLRQLLRWGVFAVGGGEKEGLSQEEDAELEEQVEALQVACQYDAPPGFNQNILPMRPSVDQFQAQFRPFSYYVAMHFAMEYLIEPTALSLAFGFKKKRTSAFSYYVLQKESSSATLPPLVFVHGIGIGLLPYSKLIKSLISVPSSAIYLIELPHISNRITPDVPTRQAVVEGISEMLSSATSAATFVGHSFGTVYVSYMVKHRPDLVLNAVFIDPIVFLFTTADLTFNFLYRKCTAGCTKSLLIDYFIRKDMFTLYTLHRNFWWYEASLWKDELNNIRGYTVVMMSQDDELVPSRMISTYLTGNNYGMDLDYVSQTIVTKNTASRNKSSSRIITHTYANIGHGDMLYDYEKQQVLLDVLSLVNN